MTAVYALRRPINLFRVHELEKKQGIFEGIWSRMRPAGEMRFRLKYDGAAGPGRQLVNYAIRKIKPIQSMITLKNDSLCFSFPEIDEVIRRLIEQHVNSTLPAIIAADRARAVGALRSFWGFRRATPESRKPIDPCFS
jgi:hypothetical protein